jgi:type I restriction enzyme R subunit
VLLEKMDVLHGMLHGFDYTAFRTTQAWQLLPGVANPVLGQEDGKKRFADTVLSASKAFALCCTLDEALTHRDELAFLHAVKAALTKFGTSGKKLSDEQKEHALRQIISTAVVSAEVVDIFKAGGLNRPDIGILSEELLEDVRHMKERNLAVELLERLLKDDITLARQDQRGAAGQVLGAAAAQPAALPQPGHRDGPGHRRAHRDGQEVPRRGVEAASSLGLNGDEMAFYDALATNEAAVRELGDETLKAIAVELTTEAAGVGHGGLVGARDRASQTPGDGEDAAQALQVPAGPAGRGDRNGAQTGRIAVRSMDHRARLQWLSQRTAWRAESHRERAFPH